GYSGKHTAGHIFRSALVGERNIENSFGFRRHVFRKIKAREVESGLPAFHHGRGGCQADQLRLPGIEWGVAIEAPELSIKSICAIVDRDLLLAERSCRQ